MYDSSVKSPVGVEFGVEYQLGNYDQCMGIKTDIVIDEVSIKPKYCLLDVNIEGYSVRSSATRHREVSVFLLSLKAIKRIKILVKLLIEASFSFTSKTVFVKKDICFQTKLISS